MITLSKKNSYAHANCICWKVLSHYFLVLKLLQGDYIERGKEKKPEAALDLNGSVLMFHTIFFLAKQHG